VPNASRTAVEKQVIGVGALKTGFRSGICSGREGRSSNYFNILAGRLRRERVFVPASERSCSCVKAGVLVSALLYMYSDVGPIANG